MNRFIVFVFFFWSVHAIQYPTKQCRPIRIPNGKYIYSGTFIHYRCHRGYVAYGEKIAKCLNPPNWSSPPPVCVKATCATKPKIPTNGSIHKSHRRAVYNFFCLPGYELRGPHVTYCDGEKWSNNHPICLPTGHKPKLFCDFEDQEICGWTSDLNHDFDWTRNSGQTPSWHLGTGPTNDHTKSTGYYMYAEASNNKINQTARLISPIFDGSVGSTPSPFEDEDAFASPFGYCLEFYYHMYGKSIGELRVFLRTDTNNSDWILNPSLAIFWKTGNQGNFWHRAFINLGYVYNNFQIVFEAVRGSSILSDIAIDDVRLIPNCTDEEQTEEPTISTTLWTEDYSSLELESCENRCGDIALSISSTYSPDQRFYKCDCDEKCFQRETCCPNVFTECFPDTDYDTSTMDYQISYSTETNENNIVNMSTLIMLPLKSTNFIVTTPSTNDIMGETTSTKSTVIETSSSSSTAKVIIPTTTIETKKPTYTTTIKQTIVTSKPTTTTVKPTTTTTVKPTTTTVKPTTTTVKPTTTTAKPTTTTVKPTTTTVKVSTTTKPAIKKPIVSNGGKLKPSQNEVLPKVKNSTSIYVPVKTTNTTILRKRVTMKPTKRPVAPTIKRTVPPKKKKPTLKKTTMIEFPTATMINTTQLPKEVTTQATTIKSTNTSSTTESDDVNVPIIKENMDNYPNDVNIISKESTYNTSNMHHGNHRTAIWVGGITAAVIICLALAIVKQRYCHQIRRRGLRRRAYGRGYRDSRSESVQYLASDENLDFRLATVAPDESDTNDYPRGYGRL